MDAEVPRCYTYVDLSPTLRVSERDSRHAASDRLARRPMSESELLEYCANLIANPPLPDDVRSALTTSKYTDGLSLSKAGDPSSKLFSHRSPLRRLGRSSGN